MPITFENSKPEISCIYVNYHSAALLRQSLESLFRFEKGVPFEVIVVNNDQTEKEAIYSLKNEFPVSIIDFFHNPGFGSACNQGSKIAKGALLFFVNPDTKWHQSFFAGVQTLFREDSLLGAVGVQLLSDQGVKEKFNAGPLLTLRNIFFPKKSPHKVEWVSGGALFIPRTIFSVIGGFDERFFMYFEDMDLGARLKNSGYRVCLSARHTLIHFGGRSSASRKTQKATYDQSLYQYTKKHWPRTEYFLFRTLHPLYRFFFPYGR